MIRIVTFSPTLVLLLLPSKSIDGIRTSSTVEIWLFILDTIICTVILIITTLTIKKKKT